MKIRKNSDVENGYSRLHIFNCASCNDEFGTYKKNIKTCSLQCQHKLIQKTKGNTPPQVACNEGVCEINVRGTIFTFDEIDRKKIEGRLWHVSKARNKKPYGHTLEKRKTYSMHSLILGNKPGFVIDHINGDTTDNRRNNLRHCSHKENMRNCASSFGKSRFKGVSPIKKSRPWRARITIDRKENHLGLYSTEIEAAIAYNNAAIKYFGEFALLNDLCNPGHFVVSQPSSANDRS